MNKIKELRQLHYMSQMDLAEKVGSTQQTISKYESGLVEPDIYTLVKFANFFNTSVDYIIGRTNQIAPTPKATAYYLTDAELKVVSKLRMMSDEKKLKTEGFIQGLLE